MAEEYTYFDYSQNLMKNVDLETTRLKRATRGPLKLQPRAALSPTPEVPVLEKGEETLYFHNISYQT